MHGLDIGFGVGGGLCLPFGELVAPHTALAVVHCTENIAQLIWYTLPKSNYRNMMMMVGVIAIAQDTITFRQILYLFYAIQ